MPDSAFQDILVDACAVTKAGVGMAGGVGRIGGKLPGKLRFALTIFVVRIRLDADFLQERIELAVTPVLFVPETAFSIGKERTVFHRGGIRIRQIQNLRILHEELTSLYEQRYKEKEKYMTTVKLEHLTAADNLYIQMELERTMNCTMLANLLKNFQEFSDEQTIVMFADPASIRLFSRCFELGNIYNRTEVLNLTFQGLQNSSTLLRDPDSFSMDTWEYDVRNELEGRMVGLEEEKKISFFEQWKKVYEEEMDSWSNWIFPLFMSCFCVVLNENIRKQQMASKEDDEKAMQIMYMKLAEYINKKDLKMDTMVIDDSLLEEAKKSSITKKVISNYILSAMQEKDRMSIPVTIKEIDEIMPKDNKFREEENYYLNYAIIQFLKRNR